MSFEKKKKKNQCHENCSSPLMLTYFDKLLTHRVPVFIMHIIFSYIRELIGTDSLACMQLPSLTERLYQYFTWDVLRA